jgi:hypothetical protein
MIMIKKLNRFNYEQKTVPYAVHKTQSKKTVNTQTAGSVGTVRNASVHLPGKTKPINTNESLCGLEDG